MGRNCCGILKLLGAGLFFGLTLTFLGTQLCKDRKCTRKKADKAVRAIGELLQDIQHNVFE